MLYLYLINVINKNIRMELINNRYNIGNIDVIDLVNEFGSPVYIYNVEKIIEQYNKMKNAFNVPNLKINYAGKALTNISILKVFNQLGSGFDAVSIQEVKLALEAGFRPEDILYTPNSVSIKEIEKAINFGVKINIDNIEVLEYFGTLHNSVPICIRINPHILAGGNSNISVGHIDSKFGISIHQIPLVKRIVETLKININGIHMHTGSDILDIDVFMQAADILFNVAMEFPNLDYIDFGSGFKVKYKPDDYETDIELFGSEMSVKFNDFTKKYGKDLVLMFEPGKFMVSEAGFFLVKVNAIKQTTSTVFASIDSGFNHLIRPMFYNSYHNIINVSNPVGRPKIYTVVGYICETDTFGWNRRINEIHTGDILGFYNAGAYGFMMSSNYNSRYKPAEVMIYNGEANLIRKREVFDDILRNQIIIDINITK
jgi:diaminopimelate decarboxylase